MFLTTTCTFYAKSIVIEEMTTRLIKSDDLCDAKPFNIWRDYVNDYDYICLRHLLL